MAGGYHSGRESNHNRADNAQVSPADVLFGGAGRLSGAGSLCTAAALSPLVILTAAHCVEGSEYSFRYVDPLGTGSIGVASVLLHSSYQRNQGSGSFNPNGDLAWDSCLCRCPRLSRLTVFG